MTFTTKDYQEEIRKKLIEILSLNHADSEKRMNLPSYSPRVDVAIPPFAFNQSYSSEYNEMYYRNRIFFDKLKDKALNRGRIDFDKNPNPRCFLAIEIENSTDNNAKHILGSITNASILGKIGIVVTMNHSACIERIHKYFDYVYHAGKIENEFKNVVLIHKSDFDELLNDFI